MKTLHLSIMIIIFTVVIGASSELVYAQILPAGNISIRLLSIPKYNFVDGEQIPISGYVLPNSTIRISLSDNLGNLENSTQATGNNTGYFYTSLGIPSHVIGGGSWHLFAVSDDNFKSLPIMVNTHGVVTMSGNFPSGLAPQKQFMLGIPVHSIQCDSSFQLIIKAEDGSPACVTSNAALALESHGWAINPKSTIMHVELDQSHYPPNNLDYYFVKGMIYTANGPVQNSTVSIFGNNIPLGNAMTDPTGCFQFNSWNNTEINQEMSNASNNHQESYTLKITSAYLRDGTHDAVNDTKSAVVYFQLFPIPPPFYVSSTNPQTIQVKQGDSASLKLSVTHLTGGPVGPMELTVQRLPCGITYAIPSNAASNNGTFNISIATQDYTRVGKYYLDVIQDTSHFENPNIIPDPYIGMINLEVLPK